MLRNSFLIVNIKSKSLIDKLNIKFTDVFKSNFELFNKLIKIHSENQLSLTQPVENIKTEFEQIKSIVSKVDSTLVDHVAALEQNLNTNLVALEKKILKAEKRKFTEQQNQIDKLKSILFPNENLQERVENFSLLYSSMGNNLIDTLYTNSKGLDQLFTVMN